jgi:AraC-like DNA-binding protein
MDALEWAREGHRIRTSRMLLPDGDGFKPGLRSSEEKVIVKSDSQPSIIDPFKPPWLKSALQLNCHRQTSVAFKTSVRIIRERCMDQRVSIVVQFMEDSLSSPAGRNLLAALQARNGQKEEQIIAAHLTQIAGLSATRLRALFKAEMGTTPLRYFRGLRRERARHMVETTTLTVSQILSDLGVGDESRFLRGFKKEMGKTMTECRKEARARLAAEREETAENR